MALRAFQANPSIGGFGDEGGSQLDYASTLGPCSKDSNKEQSTVSADSNKRTQRKQSSSHLGQPGNESCDAFVQIVKELVDNAVDACARDIEHASSTLPALSSPPTVLSKRVRVEIKPTQISIDSDDGENDGNTAMMDCLRVKISDNGCGMEDVDNCVTAFRSSKNGVDTNNSGVKTSILLRQDSTECSKRNVNLNKSKRKRKSANSHGSASDKHDSTSFTSGRYGVGLTLCLLHAQRLVPNSVTLIITSTRTMDFWIIRRYKADTQKDEIVCLKEERLPKVDKEECGTIVEVLVPGGQGAINSWPRLAEYFARFQLSIALPCSIEVQAETLQPQPLHVEPPQESLYNRLGYKAKSSADDCRVNDTNYNNLNDEVNGKGNSDNDEGDDWSDGFGDDVIAENPAENMPHQKLSKSCRERAHLEEEKKNKISLMKTAASLYKDRVDLRDTNVAYSTQFIRQKKECGNYTSKTMHDPVLEMGVIVFGPRVTKAEDDENVQSDHDKCSERKSKLQVVRLVNGVPVLDSCEALACGVMTKISRSTVVWNSFGLDISDRSQLSSSTPSFGISDSAQVAPFLKSSTHSLLQNLNDTQSSDDDDYDFEAIRNVKKRKKDQYQQARCILPAAQRLGDVLIVVHIRATPCTLPLPTLSKGRLPMNDKRIDDALENALADCLRSLQSKNLSLLLTAHQLKKVERDVKYSPLVAGAMAAVIGRAKKTLYRNTLRVASCWDDEVTALGESFEKNSFVCERVKTSSTDERAKSLMLRPLIERRLRFVVSTEFKEHQKAQENEYKRQQREEMLAERKKARASEAAESDGLNSDLSSGEESVRENASHSTTTTGVPNDENKAALFSDGFQSECSSSHDSRVEPAVRKSESYEVEDDETWSSEFGECVDGSFFR